MNAAKQHEQEANNRTEVAVAAASVETGADMLREFFRTE